MKNKKIVEPRLSGYSLASCTIHAGLAKVGETNAQHYCVLVLNCLTVPGHIEWRVVTTGL